MRDDGRGKKAHQTAQQRKKLMEMGSRIMLLNWI